MQEPKISIDEHKHLHHFGHLKVETLPQKEQKEHKYFRKLIRHPRPRQYWKEDGTLIREKEERKASWNELFYDVLYVAAVSVLGHTLRYNPTQDQFGKFALAFAYLWTTWGDTTRYINRFDTHDILHKLYIFFQMFFAVGLAINAQDAFDKDTAAILFAFSLVCSRCATGIMEIIVMYFSPRSRVYVVAAMIGSIAPLPLVIASAFVDAGTKRVALLVSYIVIETIYQAFLPIMFRFESQWRWKGIPFNIEHISERLGLYTIVVLGELVITILVDSAKQTGSEYMVITCGLLVAMTLEWVYFDVESDRQGMHAMRRYWLTGVVWYYTHFLLAISITAGGAGLGGILDLARAAADKEHEETAAEGSTASHIQHNMMRRSSASAGGGATTGEDYRNNYEWLFCSGIGATVLFTALIGMVHRSRPDLRVRWQVRVATRATLGVFIILLPVIVNGRTDSSRLVLIVSLITALMVLTESYGTLSVKRRHWWNTYDKAMEYYKERSTSPHHHRHRTLSSSRDSTDFDSPKTSIDSPKSSIDSPKNSIDSQQIEMGLVEHPKQDDGSQSISDP